MHGMAWQFEWCRRDRPGGGGARVSVCTVPRMRRGVGASCVTAARPLDKRMGPLGRAGGQAGRRPRPTCAKPRYNSSGGISPPLLQRCAAAPCASSRRSTARTTGPRPRRSPVPLPCKELPDEDLAGCLAGELAQPVGVARLELALIPGGVHIHIHTGAGCIGGGMGAGSCGPEKKCKRGCSGP